MEMSDIPNQSQTNPESFQWNGGAVPVATLSPGIPLNVDKNTTN